MGALTACSSSRCSVDRSTPVGRELLALADAAAERAYAPYSRFHVGCAVLAKDGRVIEGERRTPPIRWGLRRADRARAGGRGGLPARGLRRGRDHRLAGGCRQWLHEMKLERVVCNGGRVVTMTTDELLPESFDSSKLA